MLNKLAANVENVMEEMLNAAEGGYEFSLNSDIPFAIQEGICKTFLFRYSSDTYRYQLIMCGSGANFHWKLIPNKQPVEDTRDLSYYSFNVFRKGKNAKEGIYEKVISKFPVKTEEDFCFYDEEKECLILESFYVDDMTKHLKSLKEDGRIDDFLMERLDAKLSQVYQDDEKDEVLTKDKRVLLIESLVDHLTSLDPLNGKKKAFTKLFQHLGDVDWECAKAKDVQALVEFVYTVYEDDEELFESECHEILSALIKSKGIKITGWKHLENLLSDIEVDFEDEE